MSWTRIQIRHIIIQIRHIIIQIRLIIIHCQLSLWRLWLSSCWWWNSSLPHGVSFIHIWYWYSRGADRLRIFPNGVLRSWKPRSKSPKPTIKLHLRAYWRVFVTVNSILCILQHGMSSILGNSGKYDEAVNDIVEAFEKGKVMRPKELLVLLNDSSQVICIKLKRRCPCCRTSVQ